MKPDYQKYYDYLVKNNLSKCFTTEFGVITITDCVSNIESTLTLGDIFDRMDLLKI